MGTRGIAHEEQTYDEVLEMSESAPPVNVRNKSNLYQGPANVKKTRDLYDDLHLPQSNGFKRNVIRRLKGVAVVTVVNTVVVIAIIIFLGIREGTDMFEKNGGWSVWSLWTDCSATCDTGVQTRQRQCNNPVPSSGGQYCKGSAMDVNLCNREHCSRIREETDMLEKNGGWSVWSLWTDCSATCDTGVQTRQRQCNNPVPSSGGQYCEGSPMDIVHCNKQQCPRAEYDMIAFTSRLERKLENLRPNTTVVFGQIITNIGNNYDNNTGVFTCPRSGLYLFAVFVQSATQHEILLALKMNGEMYLTAVSEPSAAGQDESGGNVVLLNVVAGSRVWVETYSVDNQYLWPWRTTFSGVLIKPY